MSAKLFRITLKTLACEVESLQRNLEDISNLINMGHIVIESDRINKIVSLATILEAEVGIEEADEAKLEAVSELVKLETDCDYNDNNEDNMKEFSFDNEELEFVDNEEEFKSLIGDDDEKKVKKIKIRPEQKTKGQYQKRSSTGAFQCDQCDKSYAGSGALWRHVQSEHKGVKYPCTQCDYTATTNCNLKIHIRAKHEGLRFPCDYCEYQATQAGSLKAHIKARHPEKEEEFALKSPKALKVENTQLFYRKNLNKDETEEGTETASTDLVEEEDIKEPSPKKKKKTKIKRELSKLCPECGKTFQTRHHMTIHYRANHTEAGRKRLEEKKKPKNMMCNDCGAILKNEGSYYSHMRAMHSGKILQCDRCDLTFKTQSNLNSHVKLVHEEKTILCEHCTATFAFARDLEKHVRIHHMGISIKCPECDYTNGDEENVKRHYKRMHLKVRYNCTLCDAVYAGNHNLKDHMARVHNIGTSYPNYHSRKHKT